MSLYNRDIIISLLVNRYVKNRVCNPLLSSDGDLLESYIILNLQRNIKDTAGSI